MQSLLSTQRESQLTLPIENAEVIELTKPTWNINSEAELKVFMDELEDRMEKIDIEYGETLWKKYVREPCGDLNEIERRRSEILLNNQYSNTVKAWKPKTSDPLLKKRLRSAERIFLKERVEAQNDIFLLRNKLNEQHIGFKPVVLGKEMDRTDVREMLRKDPDSTKRKAAWESTAELARKIEPEVIDLLNKRNEHAQKLGYKTYVEYSLSLDLIEKNALSRLYQELEKLTTPSFHSISEKMKQQLGIDQLEPWDLAYTIDQFVKPPDQHFPKDKIIPRVKELVRSFGFIPEKLPILIKQADIPFGGICFPIKIPTDVRFVSNPRDGHRFYDTVFHEYGHAIHACFIQQQHFVLKNESGCFSEGMATILQRFATDQDWLRENTDLSDEEILRFVRAGKASRLLRLTSLVAMSTFEFLAFEDLNQDLNELWSKTQAKYLFVSENLTPQWAAQSFYTTHPVYVQNYILAEMIAAQTIAYLQQMYGRPLHNPEISRFLIENYYSPGGSIDWPEKIERATGQKLNARALAQELAA